jgi:prepilin-type processing-associated H-X9-DG protein
MHQAGLAMTMYQQDYTGHIPRLYQDINSGVYVWPYALKPYIPSERPYELIRCPAIPLEIDGSSTLSFGLNSCIVAFNFDLYKKVDVLRDPASIILIADSKTRTPTGTNPYQGYILMPEEGFPYTAYTNYGIVDYRHNHLANILYLDMHVARGKVPPNDSSGQGNQFPWFGH